MATTPVVNFQPMVDVVTSSVASLVPIVIGIAVVFGVLEALLRRFKRRMRLKERIEDQLAYEEELAHERRKRGFEPTLGDPTNWGRSHEPTLEPTIPKEESWHERVRKHTEEGVEYCPTCGKRR